SPAIGDSSVREYEPERMSRCPSPSRSTNCGVELVHHQTPGTSANLPSAFSQLPGPNFSAPRGGKTLILPLLHCPTSRHCLPSMSAQHGAAYPGASTRMAASPDFNRTGGSNSAAQQQAAPLARTTAESNVRFMGWSSLE